MSRVLLIEASPQSPADGAVVPVRLAGGGARPFNHRGHNDWRDCIVSEPLFQAQFGLDKTGWNGTAVPQASAIAIQGATGALVDSLCGLVWTDAPLTLYAGDDALADPVWDVVMSGTVTDVQQRGGQLQIVMNDLTGALARPLAAGTFAGTGGVEGIAEAEGRVKRRSWGVVSNVEGRVLDKANNIYEFGDPAHPLQNITSVKDRGRAGPRGLLDWQGSVAATFAALQTAEVPDGGAAIAPSIACVKWWTQPSGPLTADLLGESEGGYAADVANIAARIIAAAAPGMAVTNVAAIAAVRGDNAGIHVDDGGETAAQMLDRLLIPASVLWVMSPAGTVALLPIGYDDPVETLEVDDAERVTSYPPVASLSVGYLRNQRIQSDGEISSALLGSDIQFPDGTTGDELLDHVGQIGTDLDDVKTRIDIDAETALLWGYNNQQLTDYVNGLLYVSGQPVNVVFADERQQRIDGQEALAQQLNLIGVVNPSGNAIVLNYDSLLVQDGRSLGLVLSELSTASGDQSAAISTLQQAVVTPNGAAAKVVFQIDVDGKVVGYSATNDGSEGRIIFSFDGFELQDTEGDTIFTADADGVYMPKARIANLITNTANVPVRAAASSPISSSGGATIIMSTTVEMQADGWVEAIFVAKQAFGSGDQAWNVAMNIQGEQVFVVSGGFTNDSVTLQGARLCAKGTVTIDILYNAHSSVSLQNRTLFVKGLPFTE